MQATLLVRSIGDDVPTKGVGVHLSKEQEDELISELWLRFGSEYQFERDELAKEIGFYHMRLAYYRMKIKGLMWFNGRLPIDPDVRVQVWVNPDKEAYERAKQYNSAAVGEMTCNDLQSLCKQMPKPKWAEGRPFSGRKVQE